LDLDLNLAIPFDPETDDVLVNGSLVFQDNDTRVNMALSPLDLKHVSGTLFFDEHGVVDTTLQADFLEEPVILKMTTQQKPNSQTQIQMTGEFPVSALHKQWPAPVWALIEGRLATETLITLGDDPKAWDHLKLTSLLQGVAIDLPAPLGKPHQTAIPLTVNADFNFDQGIHLGVNYDRRLHSDLWFSGQSKAFALSRGKVCIDCAPVQSASQPGLVFVGKLDQVDWSLWQHVFDRLNNGTSSNLMDNLRAIDLTFGSISWLGNQYKNMKVYAAKAAEGAWSVRIQQSELAALLNYQPKLNLLTGKISKFVFAKAENTKIDAHDTHNTLKPTQIPNLSLTVDALFWDKINLGRLSLKGSSQKNVWHLDEARIESQPYTVELTGTWLQQGVVNKTDIAATMKIRNLSDLLKTLDVPPVVEAHDGTLKLTGNWHGDPRDFSLKKITGTLGIVLKNGRITHLDAETEKKLGLGKLLSVLSLQTIPRRLKLDFSDLAKTGYSFDQFEGQFALNNGVMNTENSSIDGPVAYATMKGELDLDKRLYNLDLHVTPHITASLPVVATIAGGPIAGIATWAASKVLNSGVDKVTGYTYTITGPWLEPVVQQVHIYRSPKKVSP